MSTIRCYMVQDVPPNIQRLADYINQQEKPEQFMQMLLALCKPDKGEGRP